MVPVHALPFASAGAGVGGRLKAHPRHFVVSERLDLSGGAPLTPGAFHYWLEVRRENATTEDVARRIARAFKIGERDVGRCGRKDKRAVATQWFSVPCYFAPLERVLTVDEAAGRVPAPLEVLRAVARPSKLRRNGHAGNRFRVVLSAPLCGGGGDALARCRAIAAELGRTGAPNYYGAQRFSGRGCRTAIRGAKLLRDVEAKRGGARRRIQRRLRHGAHERFALDALAAMVFNAYAADRVAGGLGPLDGDVRRGAGGGGLQLESLAIIWFK